MNFRLAAGVVKELQQTNKALIILQTKDITGLFTYYYSKDLFMDQQNLAENLKQNKVAEIENYNNLSTLAFKDENSSSWFRILKKLALIGYFTSREGMTTALNYVQVPGDYKGSVPYKKGDKAMAKTFLMYW